MICARLWPRIDLQSGSRLSCALERVAFNQIHVFTSQPEAAIALANAFGLRGEVNLTQRALRFRP